jgi:hypothetical protein
MLSIKSSDTGKHLCFRFRDVDSAGCGIRHALQDSCRSIEGASPFMALSESQRITSIQPNMPKFTLGQRLYMVRKDLPANLPPLIADGHNTPTKVDAASASLWARTIPHTSLSLS